MSQPDPVKHLSRRDLAELMVFALKKAEWSPTQIADHINTHRRTGWLRKSCPPWLRSAVGVHYALRDPNSFPVPE